METLTQHSTHRVLSIYKFTFLSQKGSAHIVQLLANVENCITTTSTQNGELDKTISWAFPLFVYFKHWRNGDWNIVNLEYCSNVLSRITEAGKMKALPRRIGKKNNASTVDFVEPTVKKNRS